MRFNVLEKNCSRPSSAGRSWRYRHLIAKEGWIVHEFSRLHRKTSETIVFKPLDTAIFASQGSPVPDGLSPEEAEEWSRMMKDPVIHDLFYGMGSSGISAERPNNIPGL